MDWVAQLLVTLAGVLAAKALDELVELAKRRAPRRKCRGKHFEGPRR